LLQALVITQEHDSPAQENSQYVARLKSTDIPVDHYEFARQPNAFTHHGNLTAALAVWQRIAKHLTTVFNYM